MKVALPNWNLPKIVLPSMNYLTMKVGPFRGLVMMAIKLRMLILWMVTVQLSPKIW